jgi:transporter family-2 protein
MFPIPLPTGEGLAMPWWALLGGLSLVLDHYAWFHMPVHAVNLWRMLGAALMIGGVALIARH